VANLLGGNRAPTTGPSRAPCTPSPSVLHRGMSPPLAAATGVDLITVQHDLAETARAQVEDDDAAGSSWYADAGSGDI